MLAQEELDLPEGFCTAFKTCRVCRTPYTFPEWQKLESKGAQYTEDSNGFYLTEHRDCSKEGCRGTMSIEWRLG